MTQPLTPIERKVYHYLMDFLSENTYQPSIREIGKRFRIKSTKTVSDLLHSLAQKGFIERDPSRSRGVRIVGYQAIAGTIPVPVIADPLPGADVVPESHVTMDRRFVPSESSYFARAGADAPAAGVRAGDLLLVDPSSTPLDGGLAASRTGDRVLAYVVGSGEQPGAGDTPLGAVRSVLRTFFDAGPVESTVMAPVVANTVAGSPSVLVS